MGAIGRLNRAQRVVLLVTTGVVLAVLAAALTHEWNRPMDGGWFAYAPNTGATFTDEGSSWPIWRDAITWIVAALVWCAAGLSLLRPGASNDGSAAPGADE